MMAGTVVSPHAPLPHVYPTASGWGIEKHNKKRDKYLTTIAGFAGKKYFLHEIIDAITLDQDNGPLLILLKELFELNTTKIEFIIDDYQQTIRSTAQKRINKTKKGLARKWSISGSAVVPNLEADNEWIMEVQGIKHKFEQSLNREKEGII